MPSARSTLLYNSSTVALTKNWRWRRPWRVVETSLSMYMISSLSSDVHSQSLARYLLSSLGFENATAWMECVRRILISRCWPLVPLSYPYLFGTPCQDQTFSSRTQFFSCLSKHAILTDSNAAPAFLFTRCPSSLLRPSDDLVCEVVTVPRSLLLQLFSLYCCRPLRLPLPPLVSLWNGAEIIIKITSHDKIVILNLVPFGVIVEGLIKCVLDQLKSFWSLIGWLC